MRAFAFVVGLLGLVVAARAQPVRVLAVAAGLPGSPRVGDQLAEGAVFSVPASTTVQLALDEEAAPPGRRDAASRRREERAVLALLGPARGRVLRRGVELLEAEAARISGPGPLVVPGGFRVEPGARGSVLFARGQLHVLSGEARVEAPQMGSSPGTRAAVAPTIALVAPRGVRLGLRGELLAARDPLPAETLERLARFDAPPAWRLPLGPVSPAEVGRAVETMRAERERALQAASCGCTESRGGAVGQLPGSGTGLSPIERSASTLRVRITGLPRAP